MPVRFGCFARGTVANDARIVDEDVRDAKLRGNSIGGSLHRIAVGHVQNVHARRRRTTGIEFRSRLPGSRFVAVGDDDRRAGFNEKLGNRTPDTPRATCNNGVLAGQLKISEHSVLPRQCFR